MFEHENAQFFLDDNLSTPITQGERIYKAVKSLFPQFHVEYKRARKQRVNHQGLIRDLLATVKSFSRQFYFLFNSPSQDKDDTIIFVCKLIFQSKVYNIVDTRKKKKKRKAIFF